MKTNAWLQAICASQKAVSHFIALLSELETIGAHKIRCSIEEYGWGKAESVHLGEENGHAALLQKLLQKKGWVPNDRERDQLRQVAHEYFEPLDHGTSDHLTGLLGGSNPHLCYLLVSYLVECRALEVYGDFYHSCKDAQVREVIQKIINDEEHHLKAMRDQVYKTFDGWGQTFQQNDFLGLENRLYENLQTRFLEQVGLTA